MRIITGTVRGRVLKAPPGADTRPTAGRVKETMFNILQFHLEGRRVLDLFAGSGQLGLEALSRGARECVFVDMAGSAVSAIRDNLKRTGLGEKARAVTAEALGFIAAEASKYDIVLLDPPYRTPLLGKTLTALAEKDILREGGFLMAEGAREDAPPGLRPPYRLQKTYDCGAARLFLYTRQAAGSNSGEGEESFENSHLSGQL